MTGQSVGSDASPLSCFLFRPRKRLEKRRKRSHTNVPNTLITRTSTPPAQTAHVRFHSRKRVHILAFAQRIAHKGTHVETGGVSDGVLLLPSDCFTRFGNPAWPGGRTANFAAFGSWLDVLPKNAESLRNSDVLMRVAVPKASRPRWAA